MFETYEVGKVVENFKGHKEEVIFDLADDGAFLQVFFKRPTQSEIDQFSSGKSFEIRFTELYDIIMITAKIGGLKWIDVPYTPHLSKDLTKFTFPKENEGLSLLLMLIDCESGEIKSFRLLGLSDKFTQSFFGAVMEHKMKNFDRDAYFRTLDRIFATYTTKKIADMSKDYCKIN